MTELPLRPPIPPPNLRANAKIGFSSKAVVRPRIPAKDMQVSGCLVVATDVECVAVERTGSRTEKVIGQVGVNRCGEEFLKCPRQPETIGSPESDFLQMPVRPALYSGLLYWGQRLGSTVRNAAEVLLQIAHRVGIRYRVNRTTVQTVLLGMVMLFVTPLACRVP